MGLSARELRIGNFIYRTDNVGTKKIIIVNNHTFSDFEVKTGQTYSGIPLTEEWLLKLGFKSNPYIDMYELGCFDIYCDKTSGILRLWCEINDRIVELKTVHHLQNLYFALKQEELKLKTNNI